MADVMKPTLYRINPNAAEGSVEHPAFVALVRDGWTVAGTFFGQDGDAGPRSLYLLMLPPREQVVAPIASVKRDAQTVAFWLALLFVVAVVGPLVTASMVVWGMR